MDVAMNPQRRVAGHNERLQIRCKGRIQWVIPKTLGNGLWAGRMVGYHHNLPSPGLGSLLLQPLHRLRVKSSCINWTESAVRWSHPDAPKICHPCPCGHLRQDHIPIQSEVRPESCAKKNHTFNFDTVVFKHVDIAASRYRFDLSGQFRNFMPVEIVVSED